METRTGQNPKKGGHLRFEQRNRHLSKIEKGQPDREEDAVRKGHFKPGEGISQTPSTTPYI